MAVTRPNVMTLRFSNKGFGEINKLADEFSLPRATVIRAMCAVALGSPTKLRESLKALSLDGGL